MPTPMPTLAQFKRFSAEIVPVVRALLLAQAHAELTRERVDAYIRPVFDSFTFTVARDMGTRDLPAGARIPSPDLLYLADDAAVLPFYAACDVANREHGYDLEPGYCPALVAETQLLRAQAALIDLSTPLFGFRSDRLFGEDRAKLLKLLIGAALKAEADGLAVAS